MHIAQRRLQLTCVLVNIYAFSIGAMSVKCNVEKIRGVQQTDNVESQTQVTFLTIADRITTSMVDNGDNAKEILNAVERLQGIVFKRVRKGSIILEVSLIMKACCQLCAL